MNLTAAKPHALKILESRSDGSGVFEVPIMGRGDLDLTTIGGNGSLKVDDEMWSQIVANFRDYPGPVPVGLGSHVPFGERGGPQLGFVEGVFARDGSLWARIDATAELFETVVRKRQVRGFSVELIRDLKHPSRKFDGWVLTGGVFTNRPASDVSYRVAASADAGVSMQINQPLSEAQESNMADEKVVSLAIHEAKVKELEAGIASERGKASSSEAALSAAKEDIRKLSATLEKAQTDLALASADKSTAVGTANRVEAQMKAVEAANKQLQAQVEKLATDLKTAEQKQAEVRVKEIVTKAINAGVAPAIFDGWEADPAAYVSAKFANIEALESFAGALSGVAPKTVIKPQPSGHVPGKESDPEKIELTADEKAAYEKIAHQHKLTVDFGTAATADEARAIFDKARAASKQ